MAEQAKKKAPKAKKVLPVPPDVATAYLIVRASLQGVLGIDSRPSPPDGNTVPRISQLQKTFVKQPGTAKFSVSLGKRVGSDCCLVSLPEDGSAEETDALWDAIETTCQEIVSYSGSDNNDGITLYHLSQETASRTLGITNTTDGNIPKPPKQAKDEAAGTANSVSELYPFMYYANGRVLAACPEGGRPYASVSSLRGCTITIDRKQSNVIAGKKAREAKLTVAYTVTRNDDGTDASSFALAEPWNTAVDATDPSITVWTPPPDMEVTTIPSEILQLTIQQQTIRYEQGRKLFERQQQQKMAAEAEAAAAASEAETAADNAEQQGNATNVPQAKKEMVVNVEKVEGEIDYTKLVEQFGSTLITSELLSKLQSKSKLPLHRFLRRNIFFSHRDLDTLLNALDKGDGKRKLYLYTGRGPSSSSMHLGHLIPFLFTKWLQEAFDVPLVIQMTDDEKFIFKGEYSDEAGDNLMDFYDLTVENAKDIIACGFDYGRTFLFSDLDYVGEMYPNVVRIQKAVTCNAVSNIFGFDGSSNIGKISFPAIQAAPSFATSFPRVLDCNRANGNESDFLCLIPCAIDQDPYFRMTRDVAYRLIPRARARHPLQGKPALIHSKFFPPLQGATGKMSSSDANSAVFLTDAPADIEAKIRSHAFSGGQDTGAKQRELGANLEIDVAYQWLSFFLEDDEELERIGKDYSTGSGEYWSTGKVKQRLIDLLIELVGEHQKRRAQITDDDVRKWMQVRKIV